MSPPAKNVDGIQAGVDIHIIRGHRLPSRTQAP